MSYRYATATPAMNQEKLFSKTVAMVVYNYYSTDARVRKYAEALVEKGYKVDVIAIKEKAEQPVYTLNNVNVYQVPIDKKKHTLSAYTLKCGFFFIITTFWLTILFFKNKYKIIHVHNMPDFLVFSALIPKILGAKVILDIHDPFPELFALKSNIERKDFIKKAFLKLLFYEEKLSLRFANFILTPTEMVKSQLVKKGVNNAAISVILNIPDKKIFDRQIYRYEEIARRKNHFVLLFAGTIEKRNGLTNVINTLPAIRARIPGIRYRIIGWGQHIEELNTLVKKLEVQDIVEFHPSMPLEQIPIEILKADAVVWFPERNTFIDLALSVKVMEALRMGKPVITTKTKCHEYYFNDGEVLFTESSDPHAIVQAVLNLYENYELLKPSDEAVKRIAAKFNWDLEKNLYYRLIDVLIQNGTNRKVQKRNPVEVNFS